VNLPTGAAEIVKLRRAGRRPAEMIIVSTIGPIDEPNHQVLADKNEKYTWSWVKGIEIMVYADSPAGMRGMLDEILTHRPAKLGLWDAIRGRGYWLYRLPTLDGLERPQSEWDWFIDFLPWTEWQNEEYQR
jgi:hypothetical protein